MNAIIELTRIEGSRFYAGILYVGASCANCWDIGSGDRDEVVREGYELAAGLGGIDSEQIIVSVGDE